MIGACLQKSGPYVFLVACACLYYLANAQLLLGHYDLGWHLAAGDLIRQQGGVPFHDPWSFTSQGRQWFNLSWLWDAGASALFQHAGFTGLVLAVIACGAAITACLAWICLATGASPLAVSIAVLSASLLYPAFAAFPNIYLAASPNMATMLFAVLFYGACLAGSRAVLLLPAIMLAWANLHGGFLIGLFILGVFGGLALLRRDWKVLRLHALAGAGCLLATLATPLGWHIYQGTAATMGSFVQAEITEWWPYHRNIVLPGSIPGMIYILAFVGLELRGRGTGPLEARLLSWLFLALGLYQFRYMAFFFLFSAVPLALHLDRLLPKEADARSLQRTLLIAGIAVACALPLTWARVRPDFALPKMVSQQDARYLTAHFPHARLLNHWNFGGLLIFYTRGAVPLFVDGRAATAYPDSLLRDYFKLGRPEVREADWDMVLKKYRIDTVLWVTTHEALRRFLVDRRGWHEAYKGAYVSIYVRP